MSMDICQEREYRGQNSKACPQVADTFSGGRKKEKVNAKPKLSGKKKYISEELRMQW